MGVAACVCPVSGRAAAVLLMRVAVAAAMQPPARQVQLLLARGEPSSSCYSHDRRRMLPQPRQEPMLLSRNLWTKQAQRTRWSSLGVDTPGHHRPVQSSGSHKCVSRAWQPSHGLRPAPWAWGAFQEKPLVDAVLQPLPVTLPSAGPPTDCLRPGTAPPRVELFRGRRCVSSTSHSPGTQQPLSTCLWVPE